MNKLHIPDNFTGCDQEELFELHSVDQFLDTIHTLALGEVATKSACNVEPLPPPARSRDTCPVAA